MKANFIIFSGGPGTYEPCDKDAHDTSWSNYVDNILLLAARKQLGKKKTEDLIWYVYKPAYEKRWKDDVKNNRKSVKEILRKGSKSYVDHLQKRAKKYGFYLYWIESRHEFWRKIKILRDPIGRLWYFGHGSNDLWLSVRHKKCRPVKPGENEIIPLSSIKLQKIKSKFIQGVGGYNKASSSRFYGCNTANFAKEWAERLGVYAEGAIGTLSFTGSHGKGGDLAGLENTCTWKKYGPDGKEI